MNLSMHLKRLGVGIGLVALMASIAVGAVVTVVKAPLVAVIIVVLTIAYALGAMFVGRRASRQ